MSIDTDPRYDAIRRHVSPDFTGPQDGWWPMENVLVGERVGKLVSYSPTTCRVVIGGYYGPPAVKKIHAGELVKINDPYNRRLRGDAPPAPTPKLALAPVKLTAATEIANFTAAGYDTSGEWSAVLVDNGTETPVRNFTVHPDGKVARRFTLPPGTYELRRR